MRRFLQLVSEETGGPLEALARQSQQVTRRHFGKTMRLFAPLYVSNECVNNCSYCGFSRDAGIFRTTLTVNQVVTEARHLHGLGFRNVLLVAGEHPKFVSDGYLQNCLDALKPFIPTLALEVGPMEDDQYAEIVGHGAEGLVVYQETYQRETYTQLHTAGPKKNFDWRLNCPERAYAGGFRRIGDFVNANRKLHARIVMPGFIFVGESSHLKLPNALLIQLNLGVPEIAAKRASSESINLLFASWV